MKFDRKLVAAALALCLMFSVCAPASAGTLDAVYGDAVYYDIAVGTYSRTLQFQNGVVIAANENKQYGLITPSGEAVVPFRYEGIWELGRGLYKVTLTDDETGISSTGVIDAGGNEKIAVKSNQYVYCSNETISVYDRDSGETEYYTLDLLPSSQDAYLGYSEEETEDPKLADYDGYHKTEYGIIVWRRDREGVQQYGLLDIHYRNVVAFGTYTQIDADYDENPVFYVQSGEKRGAIDPEGKELVPLRNFTRVDTINAAGYITASAFDTDPDTYRMKNIRSYVYKDGREVFSTKQKLLFTVADMENLISLKDEKYGLCTPNGTPILKEEYASIELDENGNLRTGTGESSYDVNMVYGLRDGKGEEIFPEKYAMIYPVDKESYVVCERQPEDKGGAKLYGTMTLDGREIIPIQYQDIRVLTPSFIELYDGKYFSIVNRDNETIIPQSLERIGIFKNDSVTPDDLGDLLSYAEKYSRTEGFTGHVLPFCIRTEAGYATIYADYVTGESEDSVPFRASNINKDGLFVYQDAEGRYGFAGIDGAVLPSTEAAASPAPAPAPSPAPEPSEPPAQGEITVPGGEAIPLTPADPAQPAEPETNPYGISSWALTEVREAIASGLVPEELQRDYGEPISRIAITRMFIRLLEKTNGKTVDILMRERGVQPVYSTFSDTHDQEVLAASALGIINGVGNKRFNPGGSLTRAEIAALINRVARFRGVATEGYTHSFSDVQDHWSSAELGWPVHAGVINGTGAGAFSPDSTLTTEQAILICYRALKALN